MQLDDNIQYSYFLFDENDRAFIEDLASFIMIQTSLQSLVSKYTIQHANDLLLLRKWPIHNISYNRSAILFHLIDHMDYNQYLVITKDSTEKYQYCCFVTSISLNPVLPDVITEKLLNMYHTFHMQGNITASITYRKDINHFIPNREHIKLLIGRHQIHLYTTTGLKYYPNYIMIHIPSTIEIKLVHPEHGEMHLTTTLCNPTTNNNNNSNDNDNITCYATIEFNSRNDQHYEDFYKNKEQ
jgi:hypothetical protein